MQALHLIHLIKFNQVLLRRQDGTTDFDLPWNSYVTGFGNPNSEFWLGLSTLRELTCGSGSASLQRVGYTDSAIVECEWELRIDVEGWEGTIANANYDAVYIHDDDYKLDVGGYSGNAGKVFSGILALFSLAFIVLSLCKEI